jgi:polyisoprenoid-binding protein YceI
MRSWSILTVLFVAAHTSAAEMKIVPATSKIEFVGSKANGSHTGGFKQFSGSVSMPGDDFTAAKVSIEIVTDSIFSDNAQLTNHLKNKDFFDVKTFPKATFVSTKIGPSSKSGMTHDITGDLTLHGVRKSITVPVKVTKSGDGVSIDGKYTLMREEFNMTYGRGMIKNEVPITLSIKAK